MDGDKCSGCRFAGPFGLGLLECRRYPPGLDSAGNNVRPLVGVHGWCGEFVTRGMDSGAGPADPDRIDAASVTLCGSVAPRLRGDSPAEALDLVTPAELVAAAGVTPSPSASAIAAGLSAEAVAELLSGQSSAVPGSASGGGPKSCCGGFGCAACGADVDG